MSLALCLCLCIGLSACQKNLSDVNDDAYLDGVERGELNFFMDLMMEQIKLQS